MGADYKGQEKGINELKRMSRAAREYLSHHFRNSILVIGGFAEREKNETISKAAHHMLEDLEKIGC